MANVQHLALAARLSAMSRDAHAKGEPTRVQDLIFNSKELLKRDRPRAAVNCLPRNTFRTFMRKFDTSSCLATLLPPSLRPFLKLRNEKILLMPAK